MGLLFLSGLVSCVSGGGGSGASPLGQGVGDENSADGNGGLAFRNGVQVSYADPISGGSIDPEKAVDRHIYMIFRKMTVLCVNTPEGKIRVKVEGHLKHPNSPDWEPRILRVVDRDEKEFIDIITDSNGDVVFDTLVGYDLNFKLYVMPKEYQPTVEIPLNTRLECKNGACKPGDDKKPKMFNLFPLDPCNIDAPECVRFETGGNLVVQHKGAAELIQSSNEEPNNEHPLIPCPIKIPLTGPLDPIPQP